jgi:hypothetical protein
VRGSAVPNSLGVLIPAGIASLWPRSRPDLNISSPQSFVESLSISVSRDGQTLEIRSSVLQRRHVDVTLHDSITVC